MDILFRLKESSTLGEISKVVKIIGASVKR